MSGNHGRQAERVLEEICSRMFGADLVLRSPAIHEPSGCKELADILIVVDDTLVVVQSKSLDIDVAEMSETNFDRIRKRHGQACRQLNTALNAQRRSAIVRGTTVLGVEWEIDWAAIRRRIGIVTLNLPDEAYDDPEVRFQYPDAVSVQRGMEVHTFVLRDLHEASIELTTPGDAIAYLDVRRDCIKSGKFVIGNELDLLAMFKTDYPQIEAALRDPSLHLSVVAGFWERFQSSRGDQLRRRDERHRPSFVVDRLIEILRSAVEYSCEIHKISAKQSASYYLTVVGKLGKLSRPERARIGKKLLEKREKTKTERYGYFLYISMRFRIGYLFLLVNEPNRQDRLAFLQFLAGKASHRIDVETLVAVGAGGAQQLDHSVDAMVIDVAELRRATTDDSGGAAFGEMQFETINEWD